MTRSRQHNSLVPPFSEGFLLPGAQRCTAAAVASDDQQMVMWYFCCHTRHRYSESVDVWSTTSRSNVQTKAHLHLKAMRLRHWDIGLQGKNFPHLLVFCRVKMGASCDLERLGQGVIICQDFAKWISPPSLAHTPSVSVCFTLSVFEVDVFDILAANSHSLSLFPTFYHIHFQPVFLRFTLSRCLHLPVSLFPCFCFWIPITYFQQYLL